MIHPHGWADYDILKLWTEGENVDQQNVAVEYYRLEISQFTIDVQEIWCHKVSEMFVMINVFPL
jgi:hypothetical protein